MAKQDSPVKLAERLNEVTNQGFIDLSVIYARLYSENPKAFISAFRNYKSIRMACAFIVQSYKATGVMREVHATGKDFSQYAKKYFDGQTARVFGETLLILYAIIHSD